MPTPVVAAAYRSPQGKGDGALSNVRSEDLSTTLVDHLLETTGLDPTLVEDLMWGCAQQRAEQDANVARVVALLSQLGEETPATTINRWCASSMQAVISAADAVSAGNRDCVITGGVESMSRVPLSSMPYGDLHPRLSQQYDVAELEMGATAEKVAAVYDVSREAQDEYALRSQRRAAEATDTGRFDDEIVPVDAGERVVDEDEGIRRDTTLDGLSDLPPAFADDGTVTAGNASQISDGAALLLVTSESFAADYGLDVLARIGRNHVAGVDPTVMGIGPVPATRGLLDRAGTTVDDYDLVEINEAFASQTVYCRRELGIDPETLNVNGGAIAIGHPLGASGARLPVTLLHEMHRRDARRGLATLCVGFGQGAAVEFVR